MNAVIALKKAKDYTDESLLGGGAVAGKNATISSIESSEGGNRITFSLFLDDGTQKTQTMDVMDGTIGKDGESPTITMERNADDDGVDIKITNPDGTTSITTIRDGKDSELQCEVVDEVLVYKDSSDATVVNETLML